MVLLVFRPKKPINNRSPWTCPYNWAIKFVKLYEIIGVIDGSVIRLRAKYPNHIWSIDFVHDKLSNKHPYKMLTVLDEYTREALCVAVNTKMGAEEVIGSLFLLFLKRTKPRHIRPHQVLNMKPPAPETLSKNGT